MARKARPSRGGSEPVPPPAKPEKSGREIVAYEPPDLGPRDYRGRHTTYTDEIATRILTRVADGELLISILADDGMPSRLTVSRWARGLQGAAAEFATLYEEAKREGRDIFAEEAFRDAEESLIGVVRTVKITKDGTQEVTIRRDDNVARSKLRVETRLKLLAMWDPRYRQAAVPSPDGAGDGTENTLKIEGGLPDGEP